MSISLRPGSPNSSETNDKPAVFEAGGVLTCISQYFSLSIVYLLYHCFQKSRVVSVAVAFFYYEKLILLILIAFNLNINLKAHSDSTITGTSAYINQIIAGL